jgi:hypothetical protein
LSEMIIKRAAIFLEFMVQPTSFDQFLTWK